MTARGAVCLACALLGAPALAAPVSHVFLVQNSGWMEPFYSDPASQYKALVAAVVIAATRADDRMVLASFNQSLPGAPSPKALLAASVAPATQRAQVTAALAGLGTARKPGSAALADTDLGEAVGAAMAGALEHKPGLVWLFTNNRNSPNNDQATARRNREFYALIHEGAQITKALAFPLRMPVKSSRYSANGLMLYVFAIEPEGARELDQLLRSGRLQQVLTEPPARLKPLDRDTVRLAPTKVENAPGVAFSLAPNGMLRADVQADARSASATIHWKLENTMYPYTIAGATVSARSVLAGEAHVIALRNDQVGVLAPGQSWPLISLMQLPVAHLPGKWSAAAIAAAGSAVVLPGTLEVRLSEQKLALSQAFRQRMATLFPGDPLPDIFTPPQQLQGSRALLPIEVRVHYGMAPLLALIGAVLGLLGALGAGAHALTRGRKVYLSVDGEPRTLTTRVGMRHAIHDQAGKQVAELKTTLFGHTLTHLGEGAQVRLGR
ncbi:hypothetical protein AAKU55_002791 [Oxalobacteraceae bacterium GrIS 1.11]